MSEALLTTAQVAAELAMSEDWVRDHAGELGAIRAGGSRAPLRFERIALEEWKQRQRLQPAPAPVRRRPGPRAGVPHSGLPRPSRTLQAHFR